MSYFSEDFIEKVRLASDIVSYIGEDVTLKGQGDRYTGLCPFPDHSEKTPSFSVSASKQVYHCFGCQKSGNIYTYIKELRGMNFVEAVHYLARQARIDIPTSYNKKGEDTTRELFNINEKACQFYQKKLFECSLDSSVWKYLKKRGYSKETIKQFRLGYAPKGNALVEYLKNSKEQNQASQLGLVAKDQQGKIYDNFRDRLIFPIVSTRKQVIGFGARALNDSLPKYINSKESKIFHKGTVFYGLNESAKYLRQKGMLLIVEGYTDFLSLWQEGFQNIVATLGTALTEDHAKLLKRYVDSVIVVFDGDEAGVKASERSLPLLLSQSLEVKSISLPNKQDPDDFIKESGRASFESLLKKSKDLFFQILQKKQLESKTEGKSPIYLLEEMLPFLMSTSKESLRVIYKQRVLDLFGTDKKAMERVLEKILKNPTRAVSRRETTSTDADSEKNEKFSLSKALEAERLLLVLCLDSQSLLDLFLKKSGIEDLKTKEMFVIFKKIETKYRQKPSNFDKILANIMHELSDKFLLLKESYPILKGAKEEDIDKIFQDSLSYLKKKKISAEVNQVILDIKMGDTGDMKQLEKVFQLTKEKLRQKDVSN